MGLLVLLLIGTCFLKASYSTEAILVADEDSEPLSSASDNAKFFGNDAEQETEIQGSTSVDSRGEPSNTSDSAGKLKDGTEQGSNLSAVVGKKKSGRLWKCLTSKVGNYTKVILVNSSGLLEFIGNLTSAPVANNTNSTAVQNSSFSGSVNSSAPDSVVSTLSNNRETFRTHAGTANSPESLPEDTHVKELSSNEGLSGETQAKSSVEQQGASMSNSLPKDGGSSPLVLSEHPSQDENESLFASRMSDVVHVEVNGENNLTKAGVSVNSSTANVTLHPCACALVLFYSRSCPFSMQLAPQFNALARVFPQLPLLAYDMANDTGISYRYGIAGIPTVLLIHNQGNEHLVRRFTPSLAVEKLSHFVAYHTDLKPTHNVSVVDDDLIGPVPSTVIEQSRLKLLLASLTFLLPVLAVLVFRCQKQLQNKEKTD